MTSIGGGGPARCADIRRELGEPIAGTAPERAASWLLVEHPGPWPSVALPPDLPREVTAVFERASGMGVRPQLVRRVTDRRRDAATVMVASCRPGTSWLERRTVRDLRALDDLDVTTLAEGRPPQFGTQAADPVALVCTHGRRDVCCARLGRPLAVLLERQLPGQVWETTHVGGDRFAPNVVALPHGTYHAGLTADDLPALAEAILQGRVLLPRLRGRAGLPFAVQAADHFLRSHLGLTAIEAVTVLGCTPSSSGEMSVRFLAHGTEWRVHVRSRVSAESRLTSCAGTGTFDRPSSFELVGLRPLEPTTRTREAAGSAPTSSLERSRGPTPGSVPGLG